MPRRRRGLARPLSQGLAHHLDLRRVRLGGRCRQAARPRRRADRVGAGQRLDAVGRPLRVPGLAGQERQRRQCRAQRPVLRAAGREGLLPGRPSRSPARRASSPPWASRRTGRRCSTGSARAGRSTTTRSSPTRGLRDPSPARPRARLAARPSRRRPSSASPCAAIPCCCSAPTAPRSPPAARRRSACSTPWPPRSSSARPASTSSPTPASPIPPSRPCARKFEVRERSRISTIAAEMDIWTTDGKKHALVDPGRARQLVEPAEGRRDRGQAARRGRALGAGPRHPAADRRRLGARPQRGCLARLLALAVPTRR